MKVNLKFFTYMLLGCLLIPFIAVIGCREPISNPKEPSYTVVKITEDKTFMNDIMVKVYVTIKPDITTETLKKMLFKIVTENHERLAGQGTLISVYAYHENDPTLKNIVASALQNYGGRIAFECNSQVSYDRELPPPTLSPAEKLRKENVDKIGVELYNAAAKQSK